MADAWISFHEELGDTIPCSFKKYGIGVAINAFESSDIKFHGASSSMGPLQNVLQLDMPVDVDRYIYLNISHPTYYNQIG